MANAVLCMKCGKWIDGRCMKMKKVTPKTGKRFCGRCEKEAGGLAEPVEIVRDRVDVKQLRLGWVKFRECGVLLYGKNFSLKMKGRVYQSCMGFGMLYRGET